MSPELVCSFEQQWPDVARRLHGMLAGKRVDSFKREDIVQETGLRLFGMWDHVDVGRPVWPLAVTIALNLIRDEARRKTDLEILGVIPDIPSRHDVEEEGLARIELGRVQEAMTKLSPAHRSVLMVEVGDAAPSKRGTNATKMLRHRARRALSVLLETAAVRAVVVNLRVKRVLLFGDRILAAKGGTSPAQEAVAPAVAALVAALALGVVPPDSIGLGGPSRAADPDPSTVAGAPPTIAISFAAADLASSVPSTAWTSARSDAARRGGAGDRADHGPRGRSPHGPAAGSEPMPIPLPGGQSAFLGGGAEVAGVGARVGDHPSGFPVCVSGAPETANPYACEPTDQDSQPPPTARVHASAGVEGMAKVDFQAEV